MAHTQRWLKKKKNSAGVKKFLRACSYQSIVIYTTIIYTYFDIVLHWQWQWNVSAPAAALLTCIYGVSCIVFCHWMSSIASYNSLKNSIWITHTLRSLSINRSTAGACAREFPFHLIHSNTNKLLKWDYFSYTICREHHSMQTYAYVCKSVYFLIVWDSYTDSIIK